MTSRLPKGLRKTRFVSHFLRLVYHGGLSQCLSNHPKSIHTWEAFPSRHFKVQVSVVHWTCDVCSDWPPYANALPLDTANIYIQFMNFHEFRLILFLQVMIGKTWKNSEYRTAIRTATKTPALKIGSNQVAFS